jgi:hypothetical protein
VLGPLSGRDGVTAGSPGPRRSGVTVGSGASGAIGSPGSLRPGTASGAGPSGLCEGDTGFAGGAAGTGGVNCATANWLAKPIVASVSAIGPRDARALPWRGLGVWLCRARMADFSKATGFVLVALCLVRGGQLAWCCKHRAGNIVLETSCRKHRAVDIVP